MKLTKKKVESYIIKRSGEELRHCPDAIANACNEMMKKFKNEFNGELDAKDLKPKIWAYNTLGWGFTI